MKIAMRSAAALLLAFGIPAQTMAQVPSAPDFDGLPRQAPAPMLGLYIKVPFGGPGRTEPWRDKTEFSLAYRITQSGQYGTHGWQPGLSADLMAFRFDAQGFNRFSLSGRDYYLVDGGISLYADGEDDDGKKDGMGTWGYVGIGVLALGGLVFWAGSEVNDIGNIFCVDDGPDCR